MVLQLDSAPTRAAIIAPLDNLLWVRRLIKELFDFDYRWEVYKPVNERRYGYYILPVLYGNRFIARFEPGRDKKNSSLLIKNWWWEPGVSQSESMCTEIKSCFYKFITYLGAEHIEIVNKLSQEVNIGWLSL